MKTVILAGGPGTRLWPLSNSRKSKAFQPIIRGQSMLQYTYEQLSQVIKPQDLYIQAPESLAPVIVEQLPRFDTHRLVANPTPKDTLPIILWVINALGEDPSEPILMRCVDQYIATEAEAAFLASLTGCIDRYDHADPAITLLCTEYTFFHPGNGYVVADGSKSIVKFIEKPSRKTVESLAKQGGLYRNPFMVITSKDALLDALGKLDYAWARAGERLLNAKGQERKQLFLDMELLSISDTVFQESSALKMDVVDYDFLDVGTYNALYELNNKDSRGNVVMGQVILGNNCHNNFIVNQTTEPLVVESTADQVIIQTPSGGLSISMGDADRIKDIYKSQIRSS